MGGVTTFVGLDVHKATIAVAVARDGLRDAAEFVGTIENTPTALGKLVAKLARKHARADSDGTRTLVPTQGGQ